MKINKILAVTLVITLFLIAGCKKKPAEMLQRQAPVTLNYYKVFEIEENIKPIISKFEQANPGIKVNYRNFNDLDKYLETVLSELAEGRGPDIISVPNTWVAQNYKKLTPAPSNFATPQVIQDVFVKVVEQDSIFIDTDGQEKVFSIPLFVDTLALYYNDEIFEKQLPELGKPGQTWESLRSISSVLSLPDTENNLIKSGIALGTGTGILRSADVIQLMFMQQGINFYDNNFSRFTFASNNKTTEVATLYNSFNKLPGGYPSWEDSLGSPTEKEIYAFATGKTAMIFGYSYLYKDIQNIIELAKRNGDQTINLKDVLITEAPQFENSQNQLYLANYYTEAVTRNSKYPDQSWKLITYLADPVNLRQYYKNDFKPTSRRELINEQRENRIYAPFANQLGAATSIPLFDKSEFNKIIQSTLDTFPTLTQATLRSSLANAQNELNKKLSSEGAFPPSKNKLAK